MIELATIYPVRRSRPYALSPSVSSFLILITLARVFAASTIPLTEDEAYYRLWSQHLAFGYFDHPPMVAWWIAVGRTIGGDTALGARLLSILSTTAVSLLIIDIGRSLGLSDQASERAALWYNAMFLIALGGANHYSGRTSNLLLVYHFVGSLAGLAISRGQLVACRRSSGRVCHAFKVFGDLYSSWSIALAAAVV